MKKILLLLFMLLFFILSIFSQTSSIKFRRDEGIRITYPGGLICLFQDSNGFMWMGTQNGFFRFDGYSFTKYNSDLRDSNTVCGPQIRLFNEDNFGNLFIATRSGLSIYSMKQERFTNYFHDPNDESSLSANYIKDIHVDKDNKIWIVTDICLDLFIPDEERFMHHFPPIDTSLYKSGQILLCAAEDSKENLWLGSWGGGLFKFDKSEKKFTRYLHDPNNIQTIPSNIIFRLKATPDNELWLGTYYNGLSYFNVATNTFIHYKPDEGNHRALQNPLIRSICLDSKNRLWVANGKTLSLFNREKDNFTNYQHDPANQESLAKGAVYDILEDRTGIIWVSTNRLNSYSPLRDKFQEYYFLPDDDTHQDYVTDFTNDNQNNLWISTYNDGIKIFSPGLKYYERITNNKSNYSLLSNEVHALVKDKQEQIWIGTTRGINIYDLQSKQLFPFRHNNELLHQRILELYEDSRGLIWICTLEGIQYFDQADEHLNKLTYGKKGLNFYVRSLTEDNAGRMWFATDNGLIRYHPSKNKISQYYSDRNNKESLSHNTINCVFQDSENHIYLATKAGLDMYLPQVDGFKDFGKKEGFPDAAVYYNILEDSHKNLWLTTSTGILKYNTQSGNVMSYGIHNGAVFNKAGFKLNGKGRFLIGGKHRGFFIFHPDSIKNNPYKPPVFITKFKIFNEEVPIEEGSVLSNHIAFTDQVIMSYKHSVFSFEFAALNYILPENNKFAYKMEGFDEEWNHTTADKRFAT